MRGSLATREGCRVNLGRRAEFLARNASFDLGTTTQIIRTSASDTLNLSGRGLLHVQGCDTNAGPVQRCDGWQRHGIALGSDTGIGPGDFGAGIPSWTLIAVTTAFAGASLWQCQQGTDDPAAA